MAKVAIVYFSGYGHTAVQAEAVREGAESVADAVVSMHRIDEAGELPFGALEGLGQADAVIYGSPTYMGGPAWQFKKFADASSKAWLRQGWKNKIAAGFTNSAFRLTATNFPRLPISGRCHSSTARSGSERVSFPPIRRKAVRPT